MSSKRKLRFGVLAADGRRSRVWAVSASASRGDVYLAPGTLPSAFHFSLHNDDYWHMKIIHSTHRDANSEGDGRLMAPEEAIPLEVIPKPFKDGITRAFLIAFSTGGLSPSNQPPDGRVLWKPPANSPAIWTHFNVFLVAPGVDFSRQMPGASIVGSILRGDGGSVFVTYHEQALDTTNLLVPFEMIEQHGEDMSAGRMAAMLMLLNEDESWRVVEGPIEATGTEGFDVACNRPWWPEVMLE